MQQEQWTNVMYVNLKIKYVLPADPAPECIPVSYTHLDVYKRQELNVTLFKFTNEILGV